MDDLDQLTRFTPQEQVQVEKEQNLYSIIKTVEFLVSTLPVAKQPRSVINIDYRLVGIRIHDRQGKGRRVRL